MKPTSVASLFAGAVAGVAAMYLLDPEQGERRRRAIAAKAGDYWDEASGTVQNQWHNLSDHAKDAGQHAYSAAQGYAHDVIGRVKDAAGHAQGQAEDAHSQAVGHARGWLDQGRKWLSGYRDQAMNYRDQAVKNVPTSAADIHAAAQNYGQAAWDQARKIGWRAHERAADVVNRGRKAVGPQQSSPVIPVALTAVSFLALGAGAMYIIDPQKGRSRRAWINDKVRSFVRRSGNTAYSKGRHMANRAYGAAAEARGAATDLVDRVNHAISEILQDPRVVKVMADANGTITLVGKVVSDQIDRLIAAVNALPGVNQVINRLESIAGKTTDTNTQSPTQGVR
jgi:gas vesicle protein